MRTRKHQSPVESTWADKLTADESSRASDENRPGPSAPAAIKEQGAAGGLNQGESGENPNADQKKANGKKQKRRKRSPRNKIQMAKADCTLAGLMADNVWLEKRVYEEAECAYHAALAANLAKAMVTKPSAPEAKTRGATEGTVTNHGGLPQRNCNHSSVTACHHVDNNVWINKSSFEDAERQFVLRFTSPLAPRALSLPLVSPESAGLRSPQRVSDEGYVSATPTPATQDLLVVGGAGAPAVTTGTTVNGKPHWAVLRDMMAEAWLEKSSYDRAERSFYENLAARQSVSKSEPSNHWNFHSGKKSKKDKQSRKSAGKAPQPSLKREQAPRVPEVGTGLLNRPVYYFLHQDSENVWLNKPAYDRAEERFYEIQALNIQHAPKPKKLPAATARKPAKSLAAPCSAKKMAASSLSTEKVWLDKYKYDDAERQYYEQLSKRAAPEASSQQTDDGASTILRDIARARENIQKSLAGLRTVLHSPKDAPPSLPQSQSGPSTSAAAAPAGGDNGELLSRVANLEQENQNLHKVVKDLQLAISKLESRLTTLEKSASSAPAACKAAAPVQNVAPQTAPQKDEEEEEDDDIDLFGSDDDEEEDAEAARIREERLRQYAEKKSKKPGLIAKSSILLDVKPWDDETDMAKLEECVRSVQMDGLVWGSSKLVPVGYGIKKLQIQCVVEDDKVGTDVLEEEITKFEDYVQSVDIAAFNKI